MLFGDVEATWRPRLPAARILHLPDGKAGAELAHAGPQRAEGGEVAETDSMLPTAPTTRRDVLGGAAFHPDSANQPLGSRVAENG